MDRVANMEEEPMKDATRTQLWVSALLIGMMVASAPGALFARDRGVNQPGAAGNTDVHRDRGFNQPGAAGNVEGVEPHRDRGFNQPGAAGNR